MTPADGRRLPHLPAEPCHRLLSVLELDGARGGN